MKRLFPLMVVSALLVTWGVAQTPSAGSNPEQATVNGCLGGSDGNYTVAEDGTQLILKITTSSIDLKPHLSQEVKLIGLKPSGAVSSGATDNTFAVTELTMISEHCVAAAAISTPAATVSTPTVDTVTPPVDAAAPTVAPALDAAAPAATVSPSSTTISTPPVDAVTPIVNTAAPTTTAGPPVTVSTPAEDAVATPVHSARYSTRPRGLSAIPDAPATVPAATVSPSPETVSLPAAVPTPPTAPAAVPATAITPTVTHKGMSLGFLISLGVLVIVLATLAPFLGRWRKRRTLERSGTPNLSFTNEASSDRDESEPRKVA